MRIEPAPSDPWCNGPIPAAAQMAAPVLEPPAFIPCFHGLCDTPVNGLSLQPFQPNSGTVVLPRLIAPASLRRVTTTASTSGTRSAKICEPIIVRTPRVKTRSLMVVGMPCSGPSGWLAAIAASACRAVSIACSRVGVQMAFNVELRLSIRSMVARISSTGDKSPFAISTARSVAEV